MLPFKSGIFVRFGLVVFLLFVGIMLASCSHQPTARTTASREQISNSGTSQEDISPLPDEVAIPTPTPSSKRRDMPWLTKAEQPRLAIIIDDWGYQRSAENDFLELDIPLTAAIIPFLQHSESAIHAAAAAGFDILVHLPMEPTNASLASMEGMIATSMTDEEISAAVKAALQAIPGAQGINNHMGSKASADTRVMQHVLNEVAQEGLFFVDSRTSAQSVAATVGDAIGVPVLERLVFLDGKDEEQYITSQLREAARLALKRGYAVAIGHVRPKTAQAISDMLPELVEMGVNLVRISEFIQKEHTLQEPLDI